MFIANTFYWIVAISLLTNIGVPTTIFNYGLKTSSSPGVLNKGKSIYILSVPVNSNGLQGKEKENNAAILANGI